MNFTAQPALNQKIPDNATSAERKAIYLAVLAESYTPDELAGFSNSKIQRKALKMLAKGRSIAAA